MTHNQVIPPEPIKSTSERVHICPRCNGKKESHGFGCGPGVAMRPITLQCNLCEGHGKVDRAACERYHLGQQIKLRRMRDKQSGREWCAQWGITAIELSYIEQGRIDAPECLRRGEYEMTEGMRT